MGAGAACSELEQRACLEKLAQRNFLSERSELAYKTCSENLRKPKQLGHSHLRRELVQRNLLAELAQSTESVFCAVYMLLTTRSTIVPGHPSSSCCGYKTIESAVQEQ